MNNINWFPGHMAKASKQLEASIKNVDFIIQVVDARARNCCSNPELIKFNKPILTLYSKSDLADLSGINISKFNFLDKSNKKNILSSINNIVQELKKKKMNKGIKQPSFLFSVVGLPNVGKSTLINLLCSKKVVDAQNRPAVTKNQTIIKISNEIFLQDNPGILFKNIKSQEVGYVLALINVIKKEVLDLKQIVEFAFNFYKKFYQKQFEQFFNILDIKSYDFSKFIDYVASKYCFITVNNQFDYEKTINFLYEYFINNKICKVDYEKVFYHIYI